MKKTRTNRVLDDMGVKKAKRGVIHALVGSPSMVILEIIADFGGKALHSTVVNQITVRVSPEALCNIGRARSSRAVSKKDYSVDYLLGCGARQMLQQRRKELIKAGYITTSQNNRMLHLTEKGKERVKWYKLHK